MFPYDSAIVSAVRRTPQAVADVLEIMQTIDTTCADTDGLKWFNWLYFQVTQAVKARVDEGGFTDPTWLARLDVVFAQFYFNALGTALSGSPAPGCWQAMFSVRSDTRITRIQFALAGMNAHINHDLCQAIVATCRATGRPLQHGTAQYGDYTSVNTTLDSMIQSAKQTLAVRLPGESIAAVPQLENVIAAFDISAAREHAWNTAEALAVLPDAAAAQLLEFINGITAALGKSLLVPLPSSTSPLPEAW
jgi:hypothetical protein